ncbi:hypothetical protein F8R89_11870 [Streptomyces sp. SS1-1]|nr:hypothetical protein F8R89_11870 [Streptomyces sp. SS1-1]
MPRVGSIRRFHGPMGGDLERVWAILRPTASLGGCVSCPLSARHTFKKSPGTGPVSASGGSWPVPEPEKAHSWRTSSPRSSGSRPTRRPGCATRPSSPP